MTKVVDSTNMWCRLKLLRNSGFSSGSWWQVRGSAAF